MPFVKGVPRPPTSGRKKGTPNKKTIFKVSQVLGERGINPTEKLLELLPFLNYDDQMRVWFFFITFCEAKPVQQAEEAPPISEEMVEKFKNVSDENLIKLVQYKRVETEEEGDDDE